MIENDWILKSKELKCCVVIPSYNNAGTLAAVIESVLEYSTDVLVVNDGSSDSTPDILDEFASKIQSVTFADNRGKGMALRYGFKWALDHGFDYMISIDSDGQHFASDIPKFLNEAAKGDYALLIGARNMGQENVPGKSSFGNNFSNFWFNLETGIKLTDTQSGFRLYPVRKMEKMRFMTRRFEFEVEVIVKAAWRDIDVRNIPINIHYDPPETRITHFRPLQDFTRISVLNTWLVTLAILYHLPRRFFKNFSKKKIKHFVRHQLFDKKEPIIIKAFSIGFGIFMGIIPIWGYQLIVGIMLSHLMRLNKAIFIVAANISIPPMIPIIVFLSFVMGAPFVDQPIKGLFSAENFGLESIQANVIQYIYGSIALAVTGGLLAFGFSFLIISLLRGRSGERFLGEVQK